MEQISLSRRVKLISIWYWTNQSREFGSGLGSNFTATTIAQTNRARRHKQDIISVDDILIHGNDTKSEVEDNPTLRIFSWRDES